MTEMTSLSQAGSDLQVPGSPLKPMEDKYELGFGPDDDTEDDQAAVTGEVLQNMLEGTGDRTALIRKIEVLLRAKGLWEQMEAMLDSTVEVPEELVQSAEIKMSVDAERKRAFFKKLQTAVTGGKGLGALPKCEVHVDGLSVSSTHPKAAGRTGPPTIGSFLFHLIAWPFEMMSKNRYVTHKVLNDVSAVFKPGTSTLVLGPPACGKSLLLRSISDKLKGSHLSFDGSIRYNGYNKKDHEFRLEKMVAYIDQEDSHIGALTVRETFKFANDCISGRDPMLIHAAADNPEKAQQMIDSVGSKIDVIARFLGLEHVKDTIVGNDMMRGVSGGQKRRVTTGEVFSGVALCVCADAISNGLDSATTFDMIQLMRDSKEMFNFTQIIVLLQACAGGCDLFDTIMLMNEGCVIFHGTKQRIIEHFRDMGYECPRRKDLADFLQEVTGEDGKQYIPEDTSHLSRPVPSTTAEFVERWKETPEYKLMQEQLTDSRENTSAHDVENLPPAFKREFLGSWWQSFELCFDREWTLVKRDPQKSVVRVFQAVLLGAVFAALYADIDKNDLSSKLGLIFQTVMFFATTAFGGLPGSFEERAVFYKQRDAGFFRTSAYLFARMIAVIPVQVAETLIFGSILYFSSGLTTSDSGTHFIYFVVMSLIINITMNQFFIVLSSVLPDLSTAMNMGSLSFLLFILFSGYIVSVENLPEGWLWMYYLNPISWAFLAFLQNEYKSSTYDEKAAGTSKRLGDEYLDQAGMPKDGIYQWYGGIALLVFFCVYFCCGTLCLHTIRFVSGGGGATGDDPNSEEDQKTVETQRRLARSLTCSVQSRKNEIQRARKKSDVGELALTPASLAWVDLSYSVDLKTRDENGDIEQLELLHDISGHASPGKCMALMGSSGAGKTTLLDVLANRKTSGHITGDVFVNGFKLDALSFSRVCGYCEQFDSHSPCSTVKESLEFSASLRLPEGTSQRAREELIATTMDTLELRDIQGAQARTLSIEQGKRLTIGVEMVANPAILFLDEPTSGLDARAALAVVGAIRSAANTGRTIVCTIHQPSMTIFESFDSLLFLKKGGKTIFFGDLGEESSHLIDQLQSIPGAPSIGPGMNPAVYMLQVIGSSSLKADPSEVWLRCNRRVALMSQLASAPGLTSPPEDGSGNPFVFRPSRTQGRSELAALTHRAFKTYWRSPEYNAIRVIVGALFALIFGSVFWQKDIDTYSSMFGRMGVIFTTTMFMGFLCFTTVLPVMGNERSVFYREKAAGMYSVTSFNFVLGLVEAPYLAVTTTVFVTLLHFTVGLRPRAGPFFWYWGFCYFYFTFSTYLGQMMTAALPNITLAQGAGFGIINLLVSFAGFLKPAGDLGALEFIYWLSPLHYAFEGMLVTQFNNDPTDVSVFLPGLGEIQIPALEFVTDFFSDGAFQYSHRHYCMGVLVALCLSTRLCTGYLLSHVNHQTR